MQRIFIKRRGNERIRSLKVNILKRLSHYNKGCLFMFEVNGIVYANEYNNSLKIVDAKVTDHLMMLITFSNGEKRVFDATILTGSAFEPLEDINIFNNFKIVHGVITWMNEDIDCAPEYIYEHSYVYEELVVL